MQRCSIREGVAFTLFLLSMAAMDSESRVLPVIILAGVLTILYCMGQACGEKEKKEPAATGSIRKNKRICDYYTTGKGKGKWKVSKSTGLR